MDDARVALRIERRLRPKEPDNFGVLTSDTFLDLYSQATTGIFAILIGVVSLSLVVGGIVIMNIMLMVVSERTREIGLRKSLGARRRDILWQILTESITLSTFGGMIGTGLGFFVAWVISQVEPAAGHRRTLVGRAGHLDDRDRRPVLRPVSGDAGRRARSDRSAEAGVAHALSLFAEILVMSWDTVRGNKLRSFLTVLGIVIGITSIVGMTSLIRGFDQSFQDLIEGHRAEHDLRREVVRRQPVVGRELSGTREAAEHDAGRRRGDRAQRAVDSSRRPHARRRRPGPQQTVRIYYRNQRTKPMTVIGTTEAWPYAVQLPVESGPVLHDRRGPAARRVVVLGQRRPRRCSRTSIRSASSCGSASRSTGHRRAWPSGRARRLQHRRGRLRGHAVHDLRRSSTASGSNDVGRGEIAERHDRRRAARGRAARAGDARGRGGHAHPPRPAARPAERLRPRHAGRDPRLCGIRSRRRRSWRWSCCRRSR